MLVGCGAVARGTTMLRVWGVYVGIIIQSTNLSTREPRAGSTKRARTFGCKYVQQVQYTDRYVIETELP